MRSSQKPTISSFSGLYRFLSNFYSCPFELNGKQYKTVEHYYQAHKAVMPDDHEWVRGSLTARDAKRRGREVQLSANWEDVKLLVMHDGLKAKFAVEGLRKRLLETHPLYLVEGNYWHDNYWGDCYCIKCEAVQGQNMLGTLLVQLREGGVL